MSGIDWEAFATIFDHFNTAENNPVLPMFCAWLGDRLDDAGLESPASIVEIGCGTGLVSEWLSDWYPESRILLNDADAAMLAVARRNLASRRGLRFEQQDGAVLLSGLTAGSVDVVVFARSFYALAEPHEVARLSLRALAPGGRVLVLDFTRPVELEPLDALFADREPDRWPLMRRVYEDFNEGIASGRYRLFDESRWSELWAGAGGRVVAYQSNEPASNTQFLCVAGPG